MLKKYRLTENRLGLPTDSIVYEAWGWDYGLAADDSRYTGIEHISVSLHEDGSIPTITAPLYMLEEINENVS